MVIVLLMERKIVHPVRSILLLLKLVTNTSVYQKYVRVTTEMKVWGLTSFVTEDTSAKIVMMGIKSQI